MAIFFLITFLLVFLSCSLILSRVNPDEGIFTTGGWLLLQGTALYKDFFSMYSPALYFILAAFYAIFPAEFVASRLFVVAMNVLTLVCFFALCRKMMDEKSALLASLFFVIWSVFTISWNVIIEPFIALFSVLLFYLVFSFLNSRNIKHLIFVGILLSSLVLLKQTMLFLSIAVFIFILLRAKLNRRELLALLLSCALLPLLFLIYLILNNAFFDFIEQAIIYDISHSSLFVFRFHFEWFAVTAFFFSIPVLALLLLLFKKMQMEKDKAALLFIWLFASVTTLLPILGCCVHFIPLVAPFAIFFGLLIDQIFIKNSRIKLGGIAPAFLKAFIVLAFLISIAGSMVYLSQYFFQNDFNDLFEVAQFVNSNSSPNDTMYTTYWDEEMYFFALRKPATKYAYMPFLFPEEIPGYQIETINSMEKAKPLFVIHSSATEQDMDPEDKIHKYILENYKLVETKKLQKPLYKTYNYVLIFRRIGN